MSLASRISIHWRREKRSLFIEEKKSVHTGIHGKEEEDERLVTFLGQRYPRQSNRAMIPSSECSFLLLFISR